MDKIFEIQLCRDGLSKQIADRIQGLIIAGLLPFGGKLPDERELAKRLDVSRPAIRVALALLADRGLIVTKQGDGSYIKEQSTVMIHD